jgi:hypothetical protein
VTASGHKADVNGPANDACPFQAKQAKPVLHSARKAGIKRRMRIQDAQLTVAKVSNPRFRGKVRKFPRHFKGHFSIGNMQVRILRGQPGSRGGPRNHPGNRQKGTQLAGSCDLTKGLRSPEFDKCRANLPKVSGANANIPVFGRRPAPETGFDHHWVVRAAAKFAVFSTSGAAVLRAVSHVLPPDQIRLRYIFSPRLPRYSWRAVSRDGLRRFIELAAASRVFRCLRVYGDVHFFQTFISP